MCYICQTNYKNGIMMKMIRTFYPVGQGGFSTEQWNFSDGETFTIAYDCGSSKARPLSCAIKKIDGVIDILVLSHLHFDHISGVKQLVENHKVRKILLPVLSKQEQLEALLYNIEHLDDTTLSVFETLLNKESFEGDKDNPVLIERIETTSEEKAPDSGNVLKYLSSSVSQNIQQKLHSEWEYILYNPSPYDKASVQLVEAVKKSSNPQIRNLINENETIQYELLKGATFEEIKSELKKIYKKVFKGKHNAYSMILYSGSKANSKVCSMDFMRYDFFNARCHCYCEPHPRYSPCACIYCGDAELNSSSSFDAFRDFWGNRWRSVGCIQIPHHGSIENYNVGLNDQPRLSIIFAGVSNTYRHPNADVLKQILKNDGHVIWINEKQKSKVYIYIR